MPVGRVHIGVLRARRDACIRQADAALEATQRAARAEARIAMDAATKEGDAEQRQMIPAVLEQTLADADRTRDASVLRASTVFENDSRTQRMRSRVSYRPRTPILFFDGQDEVVRPQVDGRLRLLRVACVAQILLVVCQVVPIPIDGGIDEEKHHHTDGDKENQYQKRHQTSYLRRRTFTFCLRDLCADCIAPKII